MAHENRREYEAAVVRLSGFLLCASREDVDIVRQHLPEHIRLTKAEPGCISFEVTQTDDPLVWRVEERFADGDAFARHQSRTRASTWGEATSAIRREYQIFGLDQS